MLSCDERELHESRIKHRTLLREYARLCGFEHCANPSAEALTLQLLIKKNRQVMVHQSKAYAVKSKCSAFLQNAENAIDNNRTVQECLKEMNDLKVPTRKSSHNLCKELAGKKVVIDKNNAHTECLADILDELCVDDFDMAQEEDRRLQNELADYKAEIMRTLPRAPMGVGFGQSL